MNHDQTRRILAITTDLGPDKVLLTDLDGVDEISRPFLFRITMATDEAPEKVEKLLGTAVTLEFGQPPEFAEPGNARRKFRGYFSRLSRGLFAVGGMTQWRAEVVPAIWFLSRMADSRIYQAESTRDIVAKLLNENGITHRMAASSKGGTPLDYCVQYRETTLDFVSRLMEKNGLFYFHEHGDPGGRLVVADMNAQATAWSGDAVPLSGVASFASVWDLTEDFSVRTGKWTTRDFDYDKYDVETHTRPTKLSKPGVASKHEFYDFPGAYPERSTLDEAGLLPNEGKDLTDIAIEREETQYHLRTGRSDIALLDAGRRLKLAADGLADPEVLVTSVRHRAQDYSHWTDSMWRDRAPVAPSYENEFTCIPQRVPFRPQQVTPRPFVRGPQTAVVTGSGDIDTDKHARVKVKFHWDRKAEYTCWIRVSQGWAGAGFGQIHIPRVNEEVIVDFLEGDPDRPIITGRVYNSKNKPPYTLPANKTQYGIKTNSVGASGSNELRFEDKGGNEQIYVHAQKDLDTVVENNETRHVKVNRTTEIDVDETNTVGGNKKTVVKGNFTEDVKGSETRTVTGNVSETFMANEDRKVTGSMTEMITGSLSQTVVGGITVTTPAAINVTATGGVTFTAPGGFTVVAPGGTRTVDLFFKMIGGEKFETFMTENNITMTKFESNLGVAVSVQGVKMETCHLKMEWVDAQIVNTPMEFAEYKAYIKNAAAAITKAAVKIFT